MTTVQFSYLNYYQFLSEILKLLVIKVTTLTNKDIEYD